MTDTINHSATAIVILTSVGTVALSELFYKFFVFETSSYKKKTRKFGKLNERQLQLSRIERDHLKQGENLTESQSQEFQSNLTDIRSLKRSILKDRHIAQLFTALLTSIIIRVLSVYFQDVGVAYLPFRPLWFMNYFVSQSDGDSQWLSAPFLFIILFITFKQFARKLISQSPRLLPQGCSNISIPRKFLFKQSSGASNDSNDSMTTLFFQAATWWYSFYSIYKVLKKYEDVKYIVSITRLASRFTGFICSLWIPMPMRYVMYGSFAYVYGINMEEVEFSDFGHYETFTLFFTRRLKAGVRTISEPEQAKSMCSPCDGRVLTCGKINSEYSTIDCVKGRSYRLDEFMLGFQGDDVNKTEEGEDKIRNNSGVSSLLQKVKDRGNQLLYMVVYLSPSDYHRFHSPAVHSGDFRRHIVGYLSPVKPSHVNKHKDVFKNNERVNIFGRWQQGFYFESAVGATNVGSIKLDFDEDVCTNQAFPTYPLYEDKNYVKSVSDEKAGPFNLYLQQNDEQIIQDKQYNSQSIGFEKGEMTGRFEMGSTIVLIFEADSNTNLNVTEGQKLNLGEPIVSYNASKQ